MKNLENFRKLDQKKIHFSKKKIHFYFYFYIIIIVLLFRKNIFYCIYFFLCKKEFDVFKKENPRPLEFILSTSKKKNHAKKLFSAHKKKFQRSVDFPF